MSAAKRMMALFEGSSEGHGKTTVGRVTRTGKTEANSRVIREPMTETLMQSHLDGAAGIGAIPINKDNMCRFGALDIEVSGLQKAKDDVLDVFANVSGLGEGGGIDDAKRNIQHAS
jgi:hypothetical protein